MAGIIGHVAIQPASPRPCEPVCVQVFDANDEPADADGASVSINGVPGAVQFLQFPSAGQRRLGITARAADGTLERQVALVDVAGEPVDFISANGRRDKAMIGVTQVAARPYVALLTLGSTLDTRAPATLPSQGRSFQVAQMFRKRSAAARLVSRSALARFMAETPHALVALQSAPLAKTKARAARRSAGPGKSRPGRATRRAVAAIYDLSHVGDLFGADFAEPLELEWDFGDGHQATSRSPTIAHDYFPAIDHARGFGQFHVSCHVKRAGITVKRTLTIRSAYSISRQLGTIVPHVVADTFAEKRYTMLTGLFTVYNVEDVAMTLDRMGVTPLDDEGEALAMPKALANLSHPIVIPPHSSFVIGVNVPFVKASPAAGQLKYDVAGFTILYAGTAGGIPVRCSAVFEVPVSQRNKLPKLPHHDLPELVRKVWPWEMVEEILDPRVNPVDEATNPVDVVANPGDAILDQVTGTLGIMLGDIADPGSAAQHRAQHSRALSAVYAPAEEMMMKARQMAAPVARTLARGGPARARFSAAAFAPRMPRGLDQSTQFLRKGPPPPGFIAEGQICDPENLSEEDLATAEAGQLVCQLTDEVMEVEMPARWMNARKGDCILSPGGDGLIGGLMLNVTPPQWYSHSGVMTRNYDEITHSTGSQKRLMDHLIGVLDEGTDGFEPSVLKWVWPGAITQTVQASIEGESFPDPEYNASYSISSFGPHTVGVTHNDQMKMIPPMVLKPDPLEETVAVRTALHAIANDARANAGRPGIKSKFHYRWYCYTDPKIGQGAPEGAAAGWAQGTRPSVCSSYIWIHAKGRGAKLETDQALVTPTDLEPSDIDTGAAVRPVTPDGLYKYSAEERKKAAEWLYDEVYNQAYEKAGWFGNILTDAADDIANQFLNAFANDDADGKDSTEWEDVVDADAVSPDDMLWWDGPSGGGLYGFAETAIFREPRIESFTVSRWKKVLTRGTVAGKVLSKGQPVSGAIVQVYDGKTTFSGADGSFSLTEVPFGPYNLKASKVIDQIFHSVQKAIDLQVENLVVDLHLLEPEERFRIAQVHIDFRGVDEETFGSNEIKDPGPEYFELHLGPDKLVNTATRTYRWGGEVRVEYVITVRLLVNNSVDVQVQGTLYEGTSEDTGDLDGQGGLTFIVGVGQTGGATLTITNTDEDDDDCGVLSLTVKNVRNDN